MGNLDKSVVRLVESEGGYTLHKIDGDRGGLTYAGITWKNWQSWRGWILLHAEMEHIDKTITSKLSWKATVDTPELRKAVAEFYQYSFWNPIHCDKMNDDHIAHMCFDFAVNAGLVRAGRMIQQVVGASIDGVIGSKTLELINAMNPADFYSKFTAAKKAFYQGIVDRDPSQGKFLKGWINRCGTLALPG